MPSPEQRARDFFDGYEIGRGIHAMQRLRPGTFDQVAIDAYNKKFGEIADELIEIVGETESMENAVRIVAEVERLCRPYGEVPAVIRRVVHSVSDGSSGSSTPSESQETAPIIWLASQTALNDLFTGLQDKCFIAPEFTLNEFAIHFCRLNGQPFVGSQQASKITPIPTRWLETQVEYVYLVEQLIDRDCIERRSKWKRSSVHFCNGDGSPFTPTGLSSAKASLQFTTPRRKGDIDEIVREVCSPEQPRPRLST